ncbi:MAG: hypothetical protein ACRDO4_10095 [Nocardioides sp.]
MVGGLARLCGLAIGEDLPNNHEDPDFNYDFLRRDGYDPMSHILETIERRNQVHEVWGWKYPRASRYLDQIRPQLRSPHLILVLRDPVASASRNVYNGASALTAVKDHSDLQNRNLELITRWQVPTLLISYERSVRRPVLVANVVAEFLGCPAPPNRSQVRAFVKAGSYQDLP